MRNKRGVWALSYTGKIIISLVFTGLALLLVRELGSAMHSGYDKQLCKQSVILNSRIKIPVVGTAHFDINCPTRYITIDTNEIITETAKSKERKEIIRCRGGRKGVDIDSEESLRCFKEFTNKIIADLLFDCWDQFGIGKLQIFSETSQERKCVICSRVEFTDEAKIVLNKASETLYEEELEFNQYLKTHSPLLHDISYFEFLMDELDAVSEHYEYYPDETYGIVYRTKYSSKIKEIAGKAVNLAYCSGKWVLSLANVANPCDDYKQELAEGELQVSTVNEFLRYADIKDECDILR